jgi:hypothetical protein
MKRKPTPQPTVAELDAVLKQIKKALNYPDVLMARARYLRRLARQK